METQLFSPCKNYNLKNKKSSKRNQNPSRDHNSRTNLKFQQKPKLSCFQKSSYKKINRPIIMYLGGAYKNP